LVSDIKRGKQAEGVLKTAPRRIFGPQMDEMMARWRKLHNEELYNLQVSLSAVT
jgi:hypothetical protein